MNKQAYLKLLSDLLNDSKEVSPLEYSRLNYDKLQSNIENYMTTCDDKSILGVLLNNSEVEYIMNDLIEKLIEVVSRDCTDYYNYLELKQKFGGAEENVENNN